MVEDGCLGVIIFMHMNKNRREIIPLIAAVSLCFNTSAFAATQPSTGTILNNPGAPSTVREKATPGLEISQQPPENASTENGPKIQVNAIHITGQTLYSEDKLLPLIADGIGKEMTLSELEALAGRIAANFRNHGYLLASAYIPAQTVKNGTVEIAVVVGQYGKIDIRNHSKLKTNVAAGFLGSLKNGDYIQKDKLDRTLLLLSDISGVTAKATLAPGAVPGTSDLIVDIADAAKTNGVVYADNWGNRYSGEERIGFSMNINNFSGNGDMLNLGGAYSGVGMNDYNLTYSLPTGSQGAKFGVGYSQMHYALGEDFASLNASGIAKTISIFESFVLTRSRNFNLNGRIEYDSKQLVDRIDSTSYYSQKRADVLVIGLNGDSSDAFGGGGQNNFALAYTSGHINMESDDAKDNDMYGTAGSYGKTNLNLSRLQAINNRLNLYISFNGQLADKNLDSSEKLQIGGPTGVRAYPVGEAPCDEGYIFTGELRWNLPTPSFQLTAFYDNGKAMLNKDSQQGDTNSRTLAGAGLGLIWTRSREFSLRLDYAWKITSDPATADNDKNGRFWLQGVKYF